MSSRAESTAAAATETHGSVGMGVAMRRLLAQVAQASCTGTPVTLQGEPGSGRIFFARAIHRASARASHPFVEIACDRSTDIAAIAARIGTEATFLLLEVGELSLADQATLVRTLAQEAFRRDDEGLRARIRLLATTSTDLEDGVKRGVFRADLYHRLTVMTVLVPPLRERRGEIPALTYEFLGRLATVQRKPVRRVSTRAMALLVKYSWPGNVQELTDAVEHAVILCEDETVHPHHLPRAIRRTDHGHVESPSLEESVGAYERDLIQDTLRSTRGSRAEAARRLKTTYRVLHYKTKKYGIDYRRFKV
jgi:Nif-specific regulatory protein